MHIFKGISQIFFPNICFCCENVLTNQEKVICTYCLHNLPVTNYTLTKDTSVLKVFYGRVAIENATALLFYQKKGIVQNLIHHLKYRNQQKIGTFIGNWLGAEMKESNQFNEIDYIIPVPLHSKRLKERGYNQVTKFGKQLADVLEVPYLENVLSRKKANKTQTNKGRMDRWNNVIELFYLENVLLFENKHILLIDDIITTGATIEACCNELNKTKNIKVSIAVMAIS